MRGALILIMLGAMLTACDDSASSSSTPSPAPTKDAYYDKLGIWDHDIAAYRNTDIGSCSEVQAENPDPMKPPASVSALRRFAHLYGQCQAALEARHAAVGELRANDIGLGATCVALGLMDTADDIDPACNLKSYLPTPK